MARITYDLDVLRSFVAGVDLGSFAGAADRLGRSTSAVSAQLKKLEHQAGAALMRTSGRGLVLTEAGETMLGYARRLLELNDEAVAAMGAPQLAGHLKLGVQEDFGEGVLPALLARFSRVHPKVRIEVRLARNAELKERIAARDLDAALIWGAPDPLTVGRHIADVPLCWIGRADFSLAALRDVHGGALPLALFDAPCLFRSAAVEALDRAGIPWRVVFTSPSLSGLWAATAAGLGVTLRTSAGVPPGLKTLPDAILPAPGPDLQLTLLQAEDHADPAVAGLADMIKAALTAGA